MLTYRKICLLAALVLASAPMTRAHAASIGLNGDTLSGEFDYPTFGSAVDIPLTPSTFVVNGDTTTTFSVNNTYPFSLTVNNDSATLQFTGTNGFTFGGHNAAPFAGPVLTVESGNPFAAIKSVSGIDPVYITDTGNVLAFNLTDAYFGGGSVNDNIKVSFVPLPGSVGMLGSALFGLIGIAGLRRRLRAPITA